eukprot:scaffold658244_cov46-Prasinocladus_malaysianus.AAC.1
MANKGVAGTIIAVRLCHTNGLASIQLFNMRRKHMTVLLCSLFSFPAFRPTTPAPPEQAEARRSSSSSDVSDDPDYATESEPDCTSVYSAVSSDSGDFCPWSCQTNMLSGTNEICHGPDGTIPILWLLYSLLAHHPPEHDLNTKAFKYGHRAATIVKFSPLVGHFWGHFGCFHADMSREDNRKTKRRVAAKQKARKRRRSVGGGGEVLEDGLELKSGAWLNAQVTAVCDTCHRSEPLTCPSVLAQHIPPRKEHMPYILVEQVSRIGHANDSTNFILVASLLQVKFVPPDGVDGH